MIARNHPIRMSELLIHVCAWIVYMLYAHELFLYANPDNFIPVAIILNYLLSAAVFYAFACFIAPVFLFKKRYLPLVISFIVAWLLFIVLDYLIEGVLEVEVYKLPPLNMSIGRFIYSVSWHFFKYAFWGVGFFGLRQYIRQLKKNYEQKLRLEKAEREAQEIHHQKEIWQAEKEKLTYENAFWRSQINPHLLFNTLNVLQTKIEQYDVHAAACLVEYSKLMRYAIETEGPDGLVEAETELENTKRLIKINQYIYDNKLHIEYKEEGQMGGRIPPHIFITLTENALKHADLSDPNHPLRIHVQSEDDNKLIFSIRNIKRKQNGTNGSTRLGMINLKKRLESLYANFYTLSIQDEQETYSVQLTLMI
jgi:two-component system, LytTR family, sensor kinase